LSKIDVVIAVHGGAGAIYQKNMTADQIQFRLCGLRDALKRGFEILLSNCSAVDAVHAAVHEMENHSGFNAGIGSSLNSESEVEMDASIMCGIEKQVGAVCGIRRLRHPINAARRLMAEDQNFFQGAAFESRMQKLSEEVMDPRWFITEPRLKQQLKAAETKSMLLDHSSESLAGKTGTVGAAALDYQGNLSAATSSGGMCNKYPGRIGDSPVVGAGVWAENNCLALSATGTGEQFIRSCFAFNIAALVKYKGLGLQEACITALDDVKLISGEGGCVAIDSEGNLALPFNSAGMYRAWINPGSKKYFLAIFDEDYLEAGTLDDLLKK
jgi:L-asparaginase / beta-aspartyl-peptidase